MDTRVVSKGTSASYDTRSVSTNTNDRIVTLIVIIQATIRLGDFILYRRDYLFFFSARRLVIEFLHMELNERNDQLERFPSNWIKPDKTRIRHGIAKISISQVSPYYNAARPGILSQVHLFSPLPSSFSFSF